MSTGTTTPNYRPRSLFGPVVLVAIGLLFLAGNLGWLHWRNFGPLFARYWPVLLIFWGVFKLGEYLWARQRGLPSPGIGAGGVVFLIFFILIGMAATRAAGVNWQALGVEMDDVDVGEPFGIFGTSHEFTENFSQEIKAGDQVRVIATRGNITVTSSSDGQAHAFVHKYVRAYSDDEARKTNEATHPKIVRQGDVWLLDMTGSDYTRGRFDLDLQVPANSPLMVTTGHGDLSVTGSAADVNLESSHGDLKVEDVKGNATLRLRHGDVTVKDVSGDTALDGYVSDVNISDIKGAVSLTGTYVGSIQLARVGKQVRFNSTRTDMQFARLEGDLTMDRGDLQVNSATGPFRLDAQTKDVRLENVTGEIRIQDRRGEINVRPQAPVGAIDISNMRGDINISLPEKAGFQIEAESDQGDIQSDFNLNVNNARRNATASGVIGKGGPLVRLKTNRGTIQIQKQ